MTQETRPSGTVTTYGPFLTKEKAAAMGVHWPDAVESLLGGKSTVNPTPKLEKPTDMMIINLYSKLIDIFAWIKTLYKENDAVQE